MKTLLVVAIVAFSEALGSYQGYAPSIQYNGPIAYPPGYDKYGAPLPVKDTPEVAQAKAAHLAAVANAGGDIYPSVHQSGIKSGSYEEPSWSAAQTQQNSGAEHIRYNGPLAFSPGYDKNGVPLPVKDTPEVAQAKAAHLAAVAKAGGDIYHSVHHSGIKSGSYEGASWSSPQIQQNSGAEHIRYYGPIAQSPGYDKYGAPLPVLETPEVAHTKAEHFQNYEKTLSNLIAKGLYEPDNTLQEGQHQNW